MFYDEKTDFTSPFHENRYYCVEHSLQRTAIIIRCISIVKLANVCCKLISTKCEIRFGALLCQMYLRNYLNCSHLFLTLFTFSANEKEEAEERENETKYDHHSGFLHIQSSHYQ